MDTRAELLKAAATVFSQHGFRGSTTRRIADAAGVNEVTLFRYFKSKEALLQEAITSNSDVQFGTKLLETPLDPERELADWTAALITQLRSRSSIIRKCMSEIEERPEMISTAVSTPLRAASDLATYLRKLKARPRRPRLRRSRGCRDADGRRLSRRNGARDDAPGISGRDKSSATVFATFAQRDWLQGGTASPFDFRRTETQTITFVVGPHMKVAISTLAAFVLAVGAPHLSAQVATPAGTPGTPVAAQSGTPLSLEDAVRMGESHSEAVGIARAGVQRGEGQQLQARSQYLPQIFGSGSYTRTLKSQYSGFGGSAPKDTTTSTAPPGPCNAYLKDASARSPIVSPDSSSRRAARRELTPLRHSRVCRSARPTSTTSAFRSRRICSTRDVLPH